MKADIFSMAHNILHVWISFFFIFCKRWKITIVKASFDLRVRLGNDAKLPVRLEDSPYRPKHVPY